MKSLHIFLIVLIMLPLGTLSKKAKERPDWAKKDIRDFSDADMERLLDQWEVSVTYLFQFVHNNTVILNCNE